MLLLLLIIIIIRIIPIIKIIIIIIVIVVAALKPFFSPLHSLKPFLAPKDQAQAGVGASAGQGRREPHEHRQDKEG